MKIAQPKKGKSNTRREFLRNSALVAVGLNFVPDTIIGNVLSKPLYPRTLFNKQNYPVRLGVNDYSISTRWTAPERISRFFAILEQLGLKHADLHLRPIVNARGENSRLMAELIAHIDHDMRQHSMTYTLNVEDPNFREETEITPGVNEYYHPGDLHRWDLRMEWLKPLLTPDVSSQQAFQGVVYDECEHMQLCNNQYSNDSVQKALGKEGNFDKPFLADTHGMDMETAYNQLVVACQKLREEHYEGRVPLKTEQVWPDLFHIFAKAGWTITPKILKEGLSSVVMSIALGAAIQYADRTHFWVSPDLWRFWTFPGHSPVELNSAFLMSYWLGAETIYVEGITCLAHNQDANDIVKDESGDALTAHGTVVRDFAKKYVPQNPRPITWRDYRPRVAIIRLPDGGWGQSPPDTEMEEYPSRNRLLGNKDHPLDKAASEWLYVWPILTHHVVHPGAISLWNRGIYPDKPDFFIPIDSVAVFDHLVEGSVLDSVECFIVCGHALSSKTFEEIKKKVDHGATCIIARRLYNQHSREQLPGKWLVVKSFTDTGVAQTLTPFLGPPDVARFRFANHIVEFTKGSQPDQIEVKVTELT